MKDFFKSKFDKFDAAFVIIGMLLYVALLNAPFKAKPFGDLNFHIETKAFAQFAWGEVNWEELYIDKAPGPDFFFFIPYFFAGPSASDKTYWIVGVLWTALFILISPLMIRRAAAALFNDTAGLLAAFLLLAFPLHIYYSLGINGEGMAFIGTVFMVYGWALWSRTYKDKVFNKYWWFFSVGALMLILSRLNVFLIVPFTILFLMYLYYKERRFSPQFKGILAFVVFVFVGTMGVRYLGNQLPGNQNTDKQMKYGAYVLHLGRFQFRNEPLDWRLWQSDFREGSQDYADWAANHKALDKYLADNPDKTYAEVYNKWVFDDYLEHPFITARQFVVKSLFGNFFIINSVKPETLKIGPLSGKFVYISLHIILNLINVVIMAGFIIFIYMMRRKWETYWFLMVAFLALTLFYAFVYMEPRYLYPLRVVFILASSYPFSLWVKRKFANRRRLEPQVY